MRAFESDSIPKEIRLPSHLFGRFVMKKVDCLLSIVAILTLLFLSLGRPAIAQPLKVGVILPLTGKLAEYGEIEKKSFLMAKDEINKTGLPSGNALELIFQDTAGIPDVGRAAVDELIIKENVTVLVGGISSSVAWEAATVAQQRKVPFLVNTASADKITEQKWGYVFRLNPPVSEHPKTLASFLRSVTRVRTAAILYENTLSGVFGLKRFTRQCEQLALDVRLKEAHEPGANDTESLFLRVRAADPDLLYLFFQTEDAASMVQRLKALQVRPRLLLGNSAGFTPYRFRDYAGDAAEHVFSSTIWAPSVPYPGAREYYAEFSKKYQSPPDYHGAQAYAAMYVIADALKRTDIMTPKGIRDSLTETDTMTIFGPVKFVSYEKKTQQNKLPTYLVQWISGKLETVWPRDVATARYVHPFPTD